MPTSGSADQSVGALLRELVDGSSQLLRQEWRLTRLELAELAARTGIGTTQIGVAAVCFALGGASLLAGSALALAGPWVRSHAEIVLAIGVVVLGAVAASLASAGLRTLARVEVARESSTEDDAWQNRRRSSAATSR